MGEMGGKISFELPSHLKLVVPFSSVARLLFCHGESGPACAGGLLIIIFKASVDNRAYRVSCLVVVALIYLHIPACLMFLTVIAYFLFQRERTGKGLYLDISLPDTYFHHEVIAQSLQCQ